MEDVMKLLEVIEWMSEIIMEEVLMGSMHCEYNEITETYVKYKKVVNEINNKYNGGK